LQTLFAVNKKRYQFLLVLT